MSILFSMSPELLKDIKPKPYYNNLLMVFTQDNPLKIAVDNSAKAIDLYRDVAEKNNDELVSTWLIMMGHDPSNFEPVGDIMECEGIEFFVEISKEIVGKKQLIVNSKQECKGKEILGSNTLRVQKVEIKIYDRDEAIQIVQKSLNQFHSGSGDNVGGNKNVY